MNTPSLGLIGFIQRTSMRKSIPLVLLALMICAGALYAARQEHRYESGSCDNGLVWWSVTTYVNGQACDITGVNCDGVRYSRDLHCTIVGADPTAGVHTESGTGPGGKVWYARTRYDDRSRLVWIGGRNLDGSFYETSISHDSPGPGELR